MPGMRRFFRLLVFIALGMAFHGACITALAQTASPFAGEHLSLWLTRAQLALIDQVFSESFGSPGYAVAIIKDGEFVLNKGYGLANLDDGIPITPGTSFHLASLSKQFTAAAIALLIGIRGACSRFVLSSADA